MRYMVDYVNVILGVLQIIIQFIAAYFSYVIYKYNRLSKAWLAVFLALMLMTVRRFIVLFVELNIRAELSEPLQFIDDIILSLFVSIFLFVGLFAMKKSFETFEIIEKKTKRKLKHFNVKEREK